MPGERPFEGSYVDLSLVLAFVTILTFGAIVFAGVCHTIFSLSDRSMLFLILVDSVAYLTTLVLIGVTKGQRRAGKIVMKIIWAMYIAPLLFVLGRLL